MSIEMTIIRTIREQRQQQFPALFTQDAIAHRLGVSTRAYQRWEAGDRVPRSRHAKALAKDLGVTVDDLALPGVSATS